MKEVSKRLKFIGELFRKNNTVAIVLIFEIVISLAIFWSARTEIVTAFKGTDEHGPFMNLDFIIKLLISIGVIIVITCVLLFNQLKVEKLSSKTFIYLLLILLPFAFNGIVFAGWIIGFVLFEKINFTMSIFDVYLINLLTFNLGILFIIGKIIKTIKKDEDIIKEIGSIAAVNIRRLVYLVIPVIVILTFLALVAIPNKRYEILMLVIGICFAWCSSRSFIIQQVKVFKKLL